MILTVAFASGCSKEDASEPSSTEAPIVPVNPQVTEVILDQNDVEFPQTSENVMATNPVATIPAQTQTIKAPTTGVPASTTAPATSATKPVTTQPVTTTKPATTKAESTTKATTTKATTTAPTTTEPTTKPAATPELLNKAVMPAIRSGTYTMMVSGFTKDKSPDDKLYKYVRGGQTAYYITIPATNLNFKVFPSDGKYYIVMGNKYCELTKEQYDRVCTSFSHGFADFNALKYKKTETNREGLQKYTCEYFDVYGSEVVLWYKNDALYQMRMNTGSEVETLTINVSSGVNSAYFTLGEGLEETDYSSAESLIGIAATFFG